MMRTRFLLSVLSVLLAGQAAAQNTLFPANPGDMIYRGTLAWTAVPGGTAGCVLMSNGATAAPTWSCALPLNFGLPPLATNRVWGNVSGGQAAPSPIDVNQFLDTVGYDVLRTPPNGALLYKEPATGKWASLPPPVTAGWVLTAAGLNAAPLWAAPTGGGGGGFNPGTNTGIPFFTAGVPSYLGGSGIGPTLFLRGDGAWAAPAATAGVSFLNTKTGSLTLSTTLQVFLGSGTYTPTPGSIFAVVECRGPGGGGGGAGGTSGQTFGGGGGGQGGYSRTYIASPSVQSVVVPIGGAPGSSIPTNGSIGADTTFGGTLAVAHGGLGGLYGTSLQLGRGGAGAPTGTGGFVLPGAPGAQGFYAVTNLVLGESGHGGGEGGAAGAFGVASTATGNAGSSGGGGSGALANNTGTSGAGGAGGQGWCVISDFTLN